MFPKFDKQAFNRLAQSMEEIKDFEDSLGIDDETFEDSIGAVDTEYTVLSQKELDRILINSAIDGDVKKVKDALEAGADVHADDDYALRWASYKGNTEIVKFLLENSADVHAANDYALRWNSLYGRVEVVKLLLEAGADVHAKNDEALRWASKYGHVEVVELLKQYM